MYHQFFIASTCLLPFPFVVLVGSTTLSPYCLSYQDHPDASKIKILLRNMTTYFLSNTYLSLLSLLPLHLLSGYSFIIILCSTEIINGLSICIPSVTTYHFQLLAIITFFVCCLTNYLINSIIIWINYLSSIRLWNRWKVCRIAITRWPLWPSITFITFGSLCSSVPFITTSSSNTTVFFVTFWTLSNVY